MPAYKYIGSDINGKKLTGVREAADEAQLKDILRREKVYLIECREYRKKQRSKKLSNLEVSDFCRQIGSMLSAGITMVGALSILQQRDLTPNMKKIIDTLYRKVRLGTPLSEAMAYTDGAFPQLLISMIESAEASGNLENVCMRMAAHFENEHKTVSNIKSAMTYPIILVVLLVVVIIAIFTFILPRFITVFGDMELPLPTRIVMAISNFLTSRWYVVITAAVFIFLGIRTILSLPVVQIKVTKALLHMGKAGHLLQIIYTARFCRTFNSLYSSGLSVIASCQISKGTIGCPYIASQFDDVVKNIRRGNTISYSLGQVDGFDIKLKSTVIVGEESGRLEQMLESTADSYEYESEQAIKKLTTLIEPIMICTMGVVIAFVFISVMLPIYQLYGNI